MIKLRVELGVAYVASILSSSLIQATPVLGMRHHTIP